MPSASQWVFGSFRLDTTNECLWHGTDTVALKPKTFAVLQYLVAHAGQLVTKAALLDAVWPETAVGDGVLKVCIAELRKALGDRVQTTSVYCDGTSARLSLRSPCHQYRCSE